MRPNFQGLPGISEYHEICLVILNSKDYLVYHETYLVFMNTTRPTWYFWIPWDHIFKKYVVFQNTRRPIWYLWIPWDVFGISEYQVSKFSRTTWYFWIPRDLPGFFWSLRDQISKDYLIILNTMRSILSKFQGLPSISEYHKTYQVFLNTRRPNFQALPGIYEYHETYLVFLNTMRSIL